MALRWGPARWVLFLVIFLLSRWVCFAADATGTLLGIVSDSAGGRVPGARVLIRNQQTNVLREAQTDSRGEYAAVLLPPGLYEVIVEKQGFRRAVHAGISVHVDQIARADIALQIGDVSQRIFVNASLPLVATDSSALGHVVGQADVARLSLNERNFLAFALLVPGAQMQADGSQNSGQGGALSVNGAREQSNNFLLDGADNNDSLINQFSVLPSVDAIAEFKVQSGNFSAEYGRSGGAQINVVLKGGTNDWHGALFEFLRNRHLDARNFFDPPDCTPLSVPGTCGSIPRFDRNQFGGSLGGPVRRDRTWFFLSYETLRLRQATTRDATVPSQVQRAAALAAVPPASRDPAGLAVFDLLPAANAGPDLTSSNRFVSSPVIRDTAHFLTLKVDHVSRAQDTFAGHYALYDDDRFNPFDPLAAVTNLPGYGSSAGNRGQNAAVAWTRVFTPRLVNELRFGLNRRKGAIFQENSGVDRSQEIGFPVVSARPVDLGFPIVVLAGFDGIGEPRVLPQARYVNTFQWSDTLAWNPGLQQGRHQLKFGADLRRVQMNLFLDALARGQWFFLGVFTGDPLQDLLRGLPTFALAANDDTHAALRSTEVNLFAQDDFRAGRRLTLNLGLRWEYNGPPADTRDRLSSPDLSSRSLTCAPQPDCQFVVAGTGGLPRGTYAGDTNNFAPRIGFAWRPLDTNRFVVRSAYGVFYDLGILNANIFPRFNPPFFHIHLFLNGGTSTIATLLSQPAFPQPVIATMIDPAYRDAYLQHWNLDLQYEFAANMLLDVAYVGSKGTALPAQRNLNQAPPGTGAFPFPQFGPVNVIQSTASSTYHSLQVSAQRRLTRGPSFLAAYTWSKCLDNASSALTGTSGEPGFPQNSLDLPSERGLSSFHAEHRLVVSFLYESSVGKRKGWLGDAPVVRPLLRDWQVSGIITIQSGRPFTVNRGVDQTLDGTAGLGIFADRPDQISDPFVPGPVPANPDPSCQAAISSGGRAADRVRAPESWFNPCAFAAPGVAFGNAARNSLLGPGLAGLDLSLAREISLPRERGKLQFRADFFNLFNHPNFDLPDRVFDSRTFSELRSANVSGNKPPRQLQLALRLSF